MPEIFIDGWQGTTGLKIVQRLKERDDLKVVVLEGEERKSLFSRIAAIKKADVTVLCLPDAAAKEIAEVAPESARIIDASTAHRTDPEWVYGMPELGAEYREKIAVAKRVANPGCHASGAIAILYPLIKSGVLAPESLLSVTSLTGFSGGGKSMIADYEQKGYTYSRAYQPMQTHKHLPEICYVTGLKNAPVFLPVVEPFYSGMMVTVPLHTSILNGIGSTDELKKLYSEFYNGTGVISVAEAYEGGFADAGRLHARDDMIVSVDGNTDRVTVTAIFDNLGKGASGACIQNMNIMLGIEERKGLVL